jgi:hypothetical protein
VETSLTTRRLRVSVKIVFHSGTFIFIFDCIPVVHVSRKREGTATESEVDWPSTFGVSSVTHTQSRHLFII